MEPSRSGIRLVVAALLAALAVPFAISAWRGNPTNSSPTDRGAATPSDDSPLDREAADRLAAGKWPFLRGAQYDGHSSGTEIAETWPDEGPPVLWVRTLGAGYSAFVVEGNRAYTQYQTLGGQYVLCLDADTGETIWEYRYDWPYEAGGIYPGPRSSPTLAHGRVYFAGPSGLVGCLTREGTLVWSKNVVEELHGKGTEFGYSSTPVVVDQRVFLPVGGAGASMVALDARDGALIWKSGDDSASYTPALPIEIEGTRQVVGYLEHVLVGFDFESGKQLWRLELSQGYDEHAAWPVYVEPFLWISSPFRAGSQLWRLSGNPETPPQPVWSSKLLSNDVCSSVHHQGHVYGFDLRDVQAKAHRPSRGEFKCLELTTGREVWSTDAPGHASVVVADEKLILFNDRGELILARATPERYEELARTAVFRGEICWTPPALCNGRLYLRTKSQAVCLDIGTSGRSEGSAAAETIRVADIPATYDFAIEKVLGVEPEYAFDVPSPTWLWQWFFWGLTILGISGIVACVVSALTWFVRNSPLSDRAWRVMFYGFAFVMGTVAMTPLSLWTGEFVFTWPVPLFVAFHVALLHVQLRRKPIASADRWRGRVAAVLFLAVSAAYYLLCRRLSLVTEWVFLSGFAGALPMGLAAQWPPAGAFRRRGWEIACTLLGFAAFYGVAVAVLAWRY